MNKNRVDDNGNDEEGCFIWWLYLDNNQSTAALVVRNILGELKGRKGILYGFEDCDDEIKKEIVDELVETAVKTLKQNN